MILASACSSIRELAQDGIGQPISVIMESQGPPSRITPDDQGGSTYTWEHWVDRGYGNRYLWSTMYWVDSKGIIYKWR